MIINKLDDTYIIKLPNKIIDVYKPIILEEITKKIITKINKNSKLNNLIHLEFYINNNYGTIIKLKDYKSKFKNNNEKTVKITINTNSIFLYKIEYFDIIKQNLSKEKIYYYKNNFYIVINNDICKKKYYKLLETSEIIYDDIELILDKGIKI